MPKKTRCSRAKRQVENRAGIPADEDARDGLRYQATRHDQPGCDAEDSGDIEAPANGEMAIEPVMAQLHGRSLGKRQEREGYLYLASSNGAKRVASYRMPSLASPHSDTLDNGVPSHVQG